jgi:dethiobiotin synthetase
LRNADALALLAECSLPLTYAQVNPVAFEPAIAPHLAARGGRGADGAVAVGADAQMLTGMPISP